MTEDQIRQSIFHLRQVMDREVHSPEEQQEKLQECAAYFGRCAEITARTKASYAQEYAEALQQVLLDNPKMAYTAAKDIAEGMVADCYQLMHEAERQERNLCHVCDALRTLISREGKEIERSKYQQG